MTTIVLFFSSLFLSSLLITLKAFEIRSSRKNILLRLIGQVDEKTLALIEGIKFRTLQLIQSVRYIILVQSRAILSDLLFKIQSKLLDEYRARQSLIMGRKNIINKGSVSFYLKKIAVEKGIGERGKIE